MYSALWGGGRTHRVPSPDISIPESTILLGCQDPDAGRVKEIPTDSESQSQIQSPSTSDHDLPVTTIKLPAEIMFNIIQHATGYVPSFGLNTSYCSPFDDRTSGEEQYRDDLMAAHESASTLRRVHLDWTNEINRLEERHSLLVDNECDWRNEIALFKTRLGSTTRRLTIDCERVGLRLAGYVCDIWETLTSVQVISFAGYPDSTHKEETIDRLTIATARLVHQNYKHLTHIMWHSREVDIVPFTTMCDSLEILSVCSQTTYSDEALRLLADGSIKNLHTLKVTFNESSAADSNLLQLLSRWKLPSIRALTVDSVVPAKGLYEFLRASGNGIECLMLTEIRKEEEDQVPLPHLPNLRQLTLAMDTAEIHLSGPTPLQALRDLALSGFDYFCMKHRPSRRDAVRALMRLGLKLRSKATFPMLRLVRLDGFDVSFFNTVRLFPFEEVALNMFANTLSRRGVRLEDNTGKDIAEFIPQCVLMDMGDPDYESSYDHQF